MSDKQSSRGRIKARIDASHKRLQRDSTERPAPPRKTSSEGSPPDDLRALVRDYPWAAIGAAAVVGAALGSLLPKGIARKLGGRGAALAGIGAELAIAYGRQARAAAGEAASEGAERLADLGDGVSARAAGLRRHAADASEAAVSSAQGTARTLLREAARLAMRARR